MANLTNILTVTEADKLATHERTIESGRQAFVEVGLALVAIRDGKLYRAGFPSFDAYCQTRWGWTRQRAYQLIESTETVLGLPEKCQPLVDTERAARELSRVPAGKQARVVERAAATGAVTVASVREEAIRMADRARAAAKAQQFELDQTGVRIPEAILAEWRRAESFGEQLHNLRQVKLAVARALEAEDRCFAEISNSTLAGLRNVESDLERVIPYAVCPTCNAVNPGKCRLCKGRGYISKFAYTTFVPEKTRELREKAAKGAQ